jgi:hypothetical protein
VDITSQCIENNGRRIGFANANDMLTFYRKTYKRAPKGADRLGPFELGIVYPEGHAERTNGAQTDGPAKPDAAAPTSLAGADDAVAPTSAPVEAPAKADRPLVSDDEKARKRAEAQKKLALMQRLDPEVKLRVAKGELTLADALREAGIDPAELEV